MARAEPSGVRLLVFAHCSLGEGSGRNPQSLSLLEPWAMEKHLQLQLQARARWTEAGLGGGGAMALQTQVGV